jgi:Caspase domain
MSTVSRRSVASRVFLKVALLALMICGLSPGFICGGVLAQALPATANKPAVSSARSAKVATLLAAKRLALVIGNSNFRYSGFGYLRAPANDAPKVAAALLKSGFTLVGGSAHLDVGEAKLRGLLSNLRQQAAENPGALLIVYYSGHGFVRGNRNFIAASDSDPTFSPLERSGIRMTELSDAAEMSNASLLVMILDACRTNSSGTLVDEPVSAHSFAAFATGFGSPALETNDNENSFFTEAFLSQLSSNWVIAEDFFSSISDDVGTRTSLGQLPVYRAGAAAKQMPLGVVFGPLRSDETSQALPKQQSNPGMLAARCRMLSADGAMWAKYSGSDWATKSSSADIELRETLGVCRAAFSAGDRSHETLAGLGIATMVARTNGIIPDSSLEKAPDERLLIQAAEEGNAWANFFMGLVQGVQAASRGSKSELSVARQRLIRAGAGGQAYVSSAVGFLLTAPKPLSLGMAQLRDPVAGTRILARAASRHSVSSTYLLFLHKAASVMKKRGFMPASFDSQRELEILLPDGFNFRSMLRQTIASPAEPDWGPRLYGLTPVDTLRYWAMSDALTGIAGPPDPLAFVDYGLSLETALATASPNDELALWADWLGCTLSGGAKTTSFRFTVQPNRPAALRLFQIAVRLGDQKAIQHRKVFEDTGKAPCTTNFDKGLDTWRAENGPLP